MLDALDLVRRKKSHPDMLKRQGGLINLIS